MPSQDPSNEGCDEPQFTLNALMRYLSATASGRDAITRQQKFPSDYQAVYYDAAADVLRRFIVGGMRDETILEDGIAAIAATTTEEKDLHNIRANIEVLEAFRGRRCKLDFGGLSPLPSPGPRSSLIISGVRLIIRPDVLLRGVVDGETLCGALKFYFSKGHSLSRSAASYGALLLMQYCGASLPDPAMVQRRQCIICDVRAGEVHHPPESTVRRAREIAAACAEIAARWPAASSTSK